MARFLAALALALLVATGVASAAAKRSIAITSLTANDGVVTVKVRVTGWTMYPRLVGKKAKSADGGHWHILVNGKYNTHVAHPTTGRTTKLSGGTYDISAELANNDHSSLKPRVRSPKVEVTVGASTTSPPPPPPSSGGDYGEGYGP